MHPARYIKALLALIGVATAVLGPDHLEIVALVATPLAVYLFPNR